MLADIAASPEAAAYISRRRELGLATRPESPLLIDADGAPITAEEADDHLIRARLVRLSLESNPAMRLGLLQNRYGPTEEATT